MTLCPIHGPKYGNCCTLLSSISLTQILPPSPSCIWTIDPNSAGILTLLAFQQICLTSSIVNGGFLKNCASDSKLPMGTISFLRHLIFWIPYPLLYLSRLVFQCNLEVVLKLIFMEEELVCAQTKWVQPTYVTRCNRVKRPKRTPIFTKMCNTFFFIIRKWFIRNRGWEWSKIKIKIRKLPWPTYSVI